MLLHLFRGVLLGLGLNLMAALPTMAEVCFLPDPSACDTENVSGGNWEINGSQETCGETFNLSKPLEGGVCEQCTDIESSYYGRYKCTCPSGQQNRDGVCVCINGNKDANGNCVTCSEPKVWNDDLKLCECPDSMITENGVCKSCPAEMTSVNNQCECENPDAHKNANGDTCIVCKQEDHKVWDEAQQACVCETEYNMVDGNCVLPGGDCDDPKKTWDSLTKSCVCRNSFEENIDPNTCDCVAGTSKDATTGECVADDPVEPGVCTPACENPEEVWYESYETDNVDESGWTVYGGCQICDDSFGLTKEGCFCACQNGYEPLYYGKEEGETWDYLETVAYFDNDGNKYNHMVYYDTGEPFTGDVDPNPSLCDCPKPRKEKNGSCVCDGAHREYNQATNTCDCEAGYIDVDGKCTVADKLTIIVQADCVDEKGQKISCDNVLKENDIKISISNLHGLVTAGESMTYNKENRTWTKVITLDDKNFEEKVASEWAVQIDNRTVWREINLMGSFSMFSYLNDGYTTTDTRPWSLSRTADDEIELSSQIDIMDDMSVGYETWWDKDTKTLTVPLSIKKGTSGGIDDKNYYAFAIGYCTSPFHPLTSGKNKGKVPCSSIPEHGLAWGSSATDDLCPIRVIAGSGVILNRAWEYADKFTGYGGEEKNACASVALKFYNNYTDDPEGEAHVYPRTQNEINRDGYAISETIPLSLKDITNGEKETLADDETLMVFVIPASQVKKRAKVTVTPNKYYSFYDITQASQSGSSYEYAFVDNNGEMISDTYFGSPKFSTIYSHPSFTAYYSIKTARELDLDYIGTSDDKNTRYMNSSIGSISIRKYLDENSYRKTYTNMFRLYPVIRLRYESEALRSYVSYFRDFDCSNGISYASCSLECEEPNKFCLKHTDNTSPINYITATRNVLSDIEFPKFEVVLSSYKTSPNTYYDITDEDCKQPCKAYLDSPEVKNRMKKGDSYLILVSGLSGGSVYVSKGCGAGDLGLCDIGSGECYCEYTVKENKPGKIPAPNVRSGYLNDRDNAVYILDGGFVTE